MEKRIHINAYTRSDGTFVKDHWRTIEVDPYEEAYYDPSKFPKTMPQKKNPEPPWEENNNDDNTQENPEQQDQDTNPTEEKTNPNPGYTTDKDSKNSGKSDTHDDNGKEGGTKERIGGIFSIILQVFLYILPIAIQILKIMNSGKGNTAKLKNEFNKQIYIIKQNQVILKNVLSSEAKKLANAKTQEEYAKYYKEFVKNKQQYERLQNSITKIEHHAKNNDFKPIIAELNTYQDVVQDNIDKTKIPQSQVQQMTDRQNKYKKLNDRLQIMSQLLAQKPNYYFDKRNAAEMKKIIDENPYQQALKNKRTMDNIAKYFKPVAPDAVQFWNLFSNNFDPQGMEYVNENGKLIYSIKQLPKWLQDIVHKKIKQQMGLDDCIGIIFDENSSVSRFVAGSYTFIYYVLKNLKKLQKQKIIFKNSIGFGIIDPNEISTFGKADIPIIFLDENGDIYALIFDTYDFNPNSFDGIITKAHTVQENGLGMGYYSLTIVKLDHKFLKIILKLIYFEPHIFSPKL